MGVVVSDPIEIYREREGYIGVEGDVCISGFHGSGPAGVGRLLMAWTRSKTHALDLLP